MTNNEILDQVFSAAARLELMQTLLNVLADMTERGADTLPEDGIAVYHRIHKRKLLDLLHIVLIGVSDAKEILEKLNGIEEEG